MDFIENFVKVIEGIIAYLKNIVSYFRSVNDGNDPEFPTFGF